MFNQYTNVHVNKKSDFGIPTSDSAKMKAWAAIDNLAHFVHRSEEETQKQKRLELEKLDGRVGRSEQTMEMTGDSAKMEAWTAIDNLAHSVHRGKEETQKQKRLELEKLDGRVGRSEQTMEMTSDSAKMEAWAAIDKFGHFVHRSEEETQKQKRLELEKLDGRVGRSEQTMEMTGDSAKMEAWAAIDNLAHFVHRSEEETQKQKRLELEKLDGRVGRSEQTMEMTSDSAKMKAWTAIAIDNFAHSVHRGEEETQKQLELEKLDGRVSRIEQNMEMIMAIMTPQRINMSTIRGTMGCKTRGTQVPMSSHCRMINEDHDDEATGNKGHHHHDHSHYSFTDNYNGVSPVHQRPARHYGCTDNYNGDSPVHQRTAPAVAHDARYLGPMMVECTETLGGFRKCSNCVNYPQNGTGRCGRHIKEP